MQLRFAITIKHTSLSRDKKKNPKQTGWHCCHFEIPCIIVWIGWNIFQIKSTQRLKILIHSCALSVCVTTQLDWLDFNQMHHQNSFYSFHTHIDSHIRNLFFVSLFCFVVDFDAHFVNFVYLKTKWIAFYCCNSNKHIDRHTNIIIIVDLSFAFSTIYFHSVFCLSKAARCAIFDIVYFGFSLSLQYSPSIEPLICQQPNNKIKIALFKLNKQTPNMLRSTIFLFLLQCMRVSICVYTQVYSWI